MERFGQRDESTKVIRQSKALVKELRNRESDRRKQSVCERRKFPQRCPRKTGTEGWSETRERERTQKQV